MRNKYRILLGLLAVLFFATAGKVSAQYTTASYSCMANGDAWVSYTGTELTEVISPNFTTATFIYPQAYASYGCAVSSEISLPFNFRLANLVTNKVKVEGTGNVICGGASTWSDQMQYDLNAYYFGNALNPQAGPYLYTGTIYYGYYPNNTLFPWMAYYTMQAVGRTKLYSQVVGTAPFRKFVVQANDMGNYASWYSWYYGPNMYNSAATVAAYSPYACYLSYQTVIYEGSSFISKIQFNYGPRSGGSSANNQWWMLGPGYYIYTYIGMKTTSYGSGYNLCIDNPSSYNRAVGSALTFSTTNTYFYQSNSSIGMEYPQVNYQMAIRYDYQYAQSTIVSPADQSIVLVNAPLTPSTSLINEGQYNGSTPIQVRCVIQRNGDFTPAYDQTITLSGAQIPLVSGNRTGAAFNMPSYTPLSYGTYTMTWTLTNSQDLYSPDNTYSTTFIVSPPNNISGIQVLTPASNSSQPIGFNIPVTIRFRNIGALGQSNVPVMAYIENPFGQVVYRDTIINGAWPSGYVMDTTFLKPFIPNLKGVYKVYGVAIMATDQNRTDDTTKATFQVRYLSDVLAARVTDPDDQQEKPEKVGFQPTVFFRNVGAQDLFDVPVKAQIRRCADNQLMWSVDSSVPELNLDQGDVRFKFPSKQGTNDNANLAPGCYRICAIARQSDDGDRTNDTICQVFSILPRLKGDYYVGVGRNFQTISNAVDTMRFRGIGGHVNLFLTDNTYTENGNTTSSSARAAIEMRSILGTGPEATVTWKPLPNVFPTIYFTGNKQNCILYSTQSANYITWNGNNQQLPSADELTAEPSKRAITMINQSTTPGSLFGIEYGRNNLTFKNLNLVNNSTTDPKAAAITMYNVFTSYSFTVLGVIDTTELHHITIDNNFIGNSYMGISDSGAIPMFDQGMAEFRDRRNYSNRISRNTIGSQTSPIGVTGIRVTNEDGMRIERNEISWITGSVSTTNYGAGITARDGNSINLLINGNRIHNIKAPNAVSNTLAGIDIQQSSTIYTTGGISPKFSKLPRVTGNRIVNNMVYDLRSNTNPVVFQPISDATINSSNYWVTNDSIFNNTVSVKNAPYAIQTLRIANPFLWNNILQNLNTNNSATAVLYNMALPRPMLKHISSDYNLIDFRNSSLFATVSEFDSVTGTSTYSLSIPRLNDWRTMTGQDVKSLSGDPMFISDTAHLPAAVTYIYSQASNTGKTLGTATQNLDFDGDVRTLAGGSPDIGADEFDGFQYMTDLAVMTITKPGGVLDNTGTTTVTAEMPMQLQGVVRNLGGLAAPNRQITATVEQSANNGLSWNTIYSNTKVYSFNLDEVKAVDFAMNSALGNTVGQLYRVTITAQNDQYNANNSASKIFKVVAKRNATLLSYNGSTAKGIQNRDSLVMALIRLGVAFDTINRNDFGTNLIDYSPWWNVIWATGDPNTAYNGALGIGAVSLKEEQELMNYLDAGQTYAKKSLIIAGQNIAQYNDPTSAFRQLNNVITDGDFMTNWLHTQFVGRYPALNYPTSTPTGFRGALTGTGIYFSFADSLNSASPDVVKPNPLPSVTGSVGSNTSRFAYFYNVHASTPLDSGAGTAWNGTRYNTVFYPFDWADPIQTVGTRDGETIAPNTSGTTRFLKGALDFVKSFGGTVLPVEFTSVSGKAEVSGNRIDWSIASQQNVDRYEVESLENNQFTWVGTVKANSSSSYSYTHASDAALEVGKTYTYRVAAIDLDGAKTTSTTVNVERGTNGAIFSVAQNFPNPFGSSTTVAYTTPENGVVSIRVLDLTGKTIAMIAENQTITGGRHEFKLDANGLSSGTYLYEVSFTNANGETSVERMKMSLSK